MLNRPVCLRRPLPIAAPSNHGLKNIVYEWVRVSGTFAEGTLLSLAKRMRSADDLGTMTLPTSKGHCVSDVGDDIPRPVWFSQTIPGGSGFHTFGEGVEGFF